MKWIKKEASEGEFVESEGREKCAITVKFFPSDNDQIRRQFLHNNCANYAAIARSSRVQSFFFLLFPPFFRWFINEKKVIGDYTTEMIIHNATRDLHDAIVKCEVHNDVGKSEDTETLDITCEYIKRGSNQL